MKTERTPKLVSRIRTVKFLIKIKPNKGTKLISDKYWMLNLSNTSYLMPFSAIQSAWFVAFKM